MNRMTRFLMAMLALVLVMPSCNKGPGEGGTGTVQGFVKLVHHPDNDYTLTPDTMVAAKTDVFIIYGDEAYFGSDVETGADGMYQFEYLLPGNYTVFAYSTLPSGEKVAVNNFDPEGQAVFSDSALLYWTRHQATAQQDGLWKWTFGRPSNMHFEDFSAEIAGARPFLFPSPDKYWYSK